MSGRALTSPGAATAVRTAFELETTARAENLLVEFVRQVEAAALEAGAPVAFSLGQVLGPWGAVVVEGLVDFLAAQGLGEDYSRAARSRLALEDLPAQVYDSARVVLGQAAEQGWSRRRLGRELSAALDPQTPFVQLGLTAALEPVDRSGPSAASIARTIARTEATAAYGYASLKTMAAFGRPQKKWVAHHDSRTRPTHRAVDGRTVPVEESFIVGGHALMYPGDPAAPASETSSCRCVLVAVGKATLQAVDITEELGQKPSPLLRELLGTVR